MDGHATGSPANEPPAHEPPQRASRKHGDPARGSRPARHEPSPPDGSSRAHDPSPAPSPGSPPAYEPAPVHEPTAPQRLVTADEAPAADDPASAREPTPARAPSPTRAPSPAAEPAPAPDVPAARVTPACDIRPLEAGDPRVVGGYPLIGRIGAGGMGTVYLGRRPGSDVRVAVKTIHPHLAVDAAFRDRFRDEAVLAGRVASFCTARVLAHGEEDGRPYIVSEYVGGMSLQHRISTAGPMTGADAHAVAVGVVSALAAIHSAGLVHRDLKPSNVMLTLSGCRVIDFGIARAQDAPGTRTAAGTVLGTPGWMAPEVLRGGQATPAADIFTWGCLVAYACTGRTPFGEGDPATVARRVMRGEPDLDGLPEVLLNAVRPALAKDPRERPSASELLLALVQGTGRPASCAASAAAPAPAASRRQARRAARAARHGTSAQPLAAPVPASGTASSSRIGGAAGPDGTGAGAGTGTGSGASTDDEGPDTAAFTVIGYVGARSSTRARVLAAVGAAAVVAVICGLVIGLGGGNGGATPASSRSGTPSPAPSAGVPSSDPAGRTVPVLPGPAGRAPGYERLGNRKGTPKSKAGKAETKKKGKKTKGGAKNQGGRGPASP